ncbi:hypothetical protein Y032_0005g2399 [Ancylostoma ceylanicum]|uniref:SCP domain-containing protein n=1 Tax=Ancylostoma ceylanicum TaxID=53326 RepID=A0A016VRU5_9BILA|nr:hypothetical protein Y032_0005g2399 [Ancylostoma ceylanicum]
MQGRDAEENRAAVPTLVYGHLELTICTVWDCDLEKEAVNILAGGCYDYVDEPPVPNDKARVFFSGYADSLPNSAEAIKNLLTISLGEIDSHALDGVVNGATSVIYKSGNVDYLLNYFTLMRTSNTKIGCAWRKCTKDRSELINVLCTLNSQTLKEGDVIYEVGKAGECTDCPPGTTCDPNTKLCVSGTTTSSTQKTNPPTTTTLAPNPPTTTTLAPNPPTTTTLAPNPPTTTTIAPSPGASFPTGE